MTCQVERYKKIIKIRAFEEYVLKLYGEGLISGTTHTYIGQEATAVAIMEQIGPNDNVFSNHRCHGHYLAYGGPAEKLLAEIMSKASGLCEGRGGSQHIHYKNFYTNGVQGGIVPNALGVAFGEKIHNNANNTIVFIGDGTLGQGVVYEALNVAAIKTIPLMLVVEDNQYAMSSRRKDMISGNIKDRISGFGIQTIEIESTNVDKLATFFGRAFDYLNTTRKPICAVVHNYRLGAHSKGDDSRDIEEIEKNKENDPIKMVINRIGQEAYSRIYNGFVDEFNSIYEKLNKTECIRIIPPVRKRYKQPDTLLCKESERVVKRINKAFEYGLEKYSDLYILGEDIRDPYGGAFKCTKGLSDCYDDRIINMPISEACIIGMAVGMAVKGILPIVEIMFGDFISLGFDQLLNHAVKYSYIYGNDIKIPILVRVPSGAQRGYGPTHSQSMEKYLCGIPGLNIFALSRFHDPYLVYKYVLDTINEPTVIIENKKNYAEKCMVSADGRNGLFFVSEMSNDGLSTIRISMEQKSKPECYVVTYGGFADEAVLAAQELMMKDEILIEVLILSQLSPLPVEDIKGTIKDESIIITFEEGTQTGGLGSEIITQCIENGLKGRFYRIATPDMPIPNGIDLEKQIIPNADTLVKKIEEILLNEL